jgi:hypothetical protein
MAATKLIYLSGIQKRRSLLIQEIFPPPLPLPKGEKETMLYFLVKYGGRRM